MTGNVTPELQKAFAPTGTLRASINLGNPILANADKASGQPVGVSIDLAHALGNTSACRSNWCCLIPQPSRSMP